MKFNLYLLLSCVLITAFLLNSCEKQTKEDSTISGTEIEAAEQIIGLNFTPVERDSMIDNLLEERKNYEYIREENIPNDIPPALNFNPLPLGFSIPSGKSYLKFDNQTRVKLPANREELAFYSIRELGYLIRTGQISSTELTIFFLERLRAFDKKLHCVITYMEQSALKEAAEADKEIRAGEYRGFLHGIPYGAKDLLATKDYKTTWGAMPFKDQVLGYDATIIKKLRQAGAVLIAKLTLGALAWGDVWYGEKTRNPWNPEQGSSGSSAGSAAATAAGLVPFAIGTETWGSIVSPATRCGTSGLRPTFGRVSRNGAMALSWSMDKIGPICRSVEDCAIVFNSIIGSDEFDQTVIDAPFQYSSKIDIKQLRIGYLINAFDQDYPNKENDLSTLNKIRELGVNLIEVTLPDLPVSSLSFILSAEAAAAFDDLTRSGKDDMMVRQIKNAWPNAFRSARFIPAVEYIQANRVRFQLIQEMDKIMQNVDIYIAPTFDDDNLLLTNLTGHPCVVIPNGFNEERTPTSISFLGRLFDEGRLLAFAKTYQQATDFHLQYPPLFFEGDKN